MADIRPPQTQRLGATAPAPKEENVGGVSFVQKEAPVQEKDPTRDKVQRGLKHAGIATEYKQEEVPKKQPTGSMTILKQLRTYSDDVATILKKAGGSKVSIQMAEKKRNDERVRNEKKREAEEQEELKREEELRIQREVLQQREEERMRKAEELQSVPQKGEQETTPAQPQHTTLYTPPPPPFKKNEAQIAAEQKIRMEQERIRSEQTKIRNAREFRREERSLKPVEVAGGQKRHQRIGAVAVSIIFLLLGSGIFFGAYTLFFTEEKIPLTLSINTLVLAEKSIPIDVSNLSASDIKARLTQLRDTTEVPPKTIAHLKVFQKHGTGEEGEFTEQELTVESLFNVLAPNAKEALTRSFDTAYMLGLYKTDHNDVFLILKPTFYENAFAGMLTWEKYMHGDLSPFFGIASKNTDSEHVGTSTTVRKNSFEDSVIENKDTRIMVDQNGNITLLYSFVDRNTLIIANSREVFLEIFKRLSAKRISR